MARNWDTYGRQSIDLAHAVSSFGFSAAKKGTRLGFAVARGIATTAVGVTTSVLDFALFGGGPVTKPVFGLAVHTVLTVAERLTLAPIHLSEYITTTSLYAAHSSINVLSVIFPGSSDASFSLASFIDLVRRETTRDGPDLPEGKYGVTQIARALIGWGSLQGVTQQWQEQCWFKHLKEVTVHPHHHHKPSEPRLQRKPSRIRVTSDVIFPGQQGPQIISADIGEPQSPGIRSRASSIYLSRTRSYMSLHRQRASNSTVAEVVPSMTTEDLKFTLRRLSKMVLAGYGGASLLFFGISPRALAADIHKKSRSFAKSISLSMAGEKTREEAKLADAIDASEAEAAGDDVIEEEPPVQFSWWDVLLGKHDQEIFELSTAHLADGKGRNKNKSNKTASVDKGKMKAKAVFGNEHLMPRFWVLTDHGRGQVVLVIRGTMSLNEIAVDLTCEYEEFRPAATPALNEEEEDTLPGQFSFPRIGQKQADSDSKDSKDQTYFVHGGMLRMARLMGDIGKPVQLAVLEALRNNPDFELVLCGHSLGAGVAALLGMLWADPKTCLTVESSGLPTNRPVSVYCFAPPALTDVALARLCSRLVVSFVYSNDVVSRLSVGTVVNLRNVAMWLCEAEEKGNGSEGWSAVTARAKKWKSGQGSEEDQQWFIAMRKTLEANMQNPHLYPPGRVLWAMRDGELHPTHQLPGNTDKDKLRLFEVNDVEKVFSQIVFASNMLSAHLPHQYDHVLHDLL